MIDPKRDPNWKPSPELLAAFADGELDGRDEAAELRAHIEGWLAANPAAQAELDANRRLRRLWDRTSPPEPSAETWRKTVAGVQRPAPAPPRSSGGRVLVGAALVACLGWALLLLGNFDTQKPKPPVEVFQVAEDADVDIIHIDGTSIDSIVVGRLPLSGPLELADPGDVLITNIAPRDNMRPMPAQQRPILWLLARDEGDGE